MVSGNDIAMSILLNTKDQTAAGVDSAQARFSKFAEGVKKHTVAISALGASTGVAAGFLSEAANAAAEDAADTDRLRKAVENSGVAWDSVSGKIDERIKKGQSLAFSDDQVRGSLSLLTAETGSLDEAMQRQTLAMDLARGMNIDLNTASKLLGKVTDDNIKVLGRYGIHVDKVAVSEKDHQKAVADVTMAQLAHDKAAQQLLATQAALHGKTKLTAAEQLKLREAHQAVDAATKKLAETQDRAKKTTEEGANQAALFAAVQQKFGGQAEQYGSSTAASIFKVKDAIGEWKESLGAALGPMQPFVALLPGISAGMTLAGAALGPMASGLVTLATAQRTAAIASGILQLALGPVGFTILAIAGVVALLAFAWSHNFGDIQGKTKAVVAVVGPILSGFFGTMQGLWQAAGPIIQAAARIILAPIFTIIDTVSRAIGLLEALGVIKHRVHVTASDISAPRGGPAGALGHIAAASGFEGRVTRPTLFLTGEGGAAEDVSIRPVGRAGSAGGAVFNIVINGNVDSRARVQELGVEFDRVRRLKGGHSVVAA